jgi:anti-sigma factor RsiW
VWLYREDEMSAKPYITCRQLINFIIDYVDGALDETANAEFERHLGVCPSCRNYLESYRVTMSVTKISITDAPLDDVPDELVERILSRR